MKQSSKRKLKRKLRRIALFIYTYRKTISIFILITFLILFNILYLSWLNKKTANELKEYVDDKVESSVVLSSDKKVIEKEKIVLKDPEMNYTHFTYMQLNIENILQNPELPTGCEITSLATVINYLDPQTKVDKLNLADNFLKKGEIGKTNPDTAFIGNPRDKHSFGANAPVLVDAAQNYYALIDFPRTVENLTGTESEELLKYVENGYPVMVWATIGMLDTYKTVTWNINGKEISWDANFHCLVLIGFDFNESVYYFADPLKEGITAYDIETFKDRYNKIGKQAIVIY